MPAKDLSPIGGRLKAWRTAKGFTQSTAAKVLKMPFRTYVDIERDVSRSTAFTRGILLRMLEMHEEETATSC